ncbi:uncharacterized protein BP01DRAFT_370702 [Aspergillus saccharolyticus JOP 1030-1]|uniref:Uncharacterized protein n=1 Tax=Aspergillus saccharolyticus JOP 1030-1 TaxID=1450539 RepID=A0A318ZR88_9EURO|nr:hypothetical protein BP01DRAFT_370702 [Aspergillus saccharolyticus JOP 1030-1]PYH49165.1 hypothetical protein BP01DRAFT_370702 [Aspergillus saccharolyticus JOP 1030-1]
MDDPIMWGFLPLRYWLSLSSSNKRWGFGSHDICYQTRPLALFFTMGQVLPTHRLAHSPHGGLAQPVVTQAIRLLSKGPFPADPHLARPERQSWSLQNVCVDPFSDLPTAFTTDGHDSHLSPSSFACNSYSWFHIFPEGMIHQAPNKTMRYFKWGVARLILEASECPDVVPIWLEGLDQVMHESREFPRFLPRVGKEVSITFGKKVDTEAVFGESRRKWQQIKAKAERTSPDTRDLPLGVLNDELLYGTEAVELRKEVTKKIRDLVLEVRRSRGHSDEDPKEGLVETWIREGPKRDGKMLDDSWFKKNAYAKPASTAHHTLASSGFRNDRLRPSASAATEQQQQQQPSVNELIDHLRRTQVTRPSDQGPENPYAHNRFVVPRTVHPSLRNLLELPETPPPRPRPGSRRHAVGARRLRRTPGPPPPQSWLVGNYNYLENREEEDDAAQESARAGRTIYRLERLPGTTFPAKGSLQHTVLKNMALYWGWHLEYDGLFLADLPNHVKVRLLSYISIYTRDHEIPPSLGLRPLFTRPHHPAGDHTPGFEVGSETAAQQPENDGEITRLDLGSALGRWLTLKQVSSELLTTTKRLTPLIQQHTDSEAAAAVPSSWEDEYDEQLPPPKGAPLTTTTLRIPRFENLRYLSLAHPTPGSANWNSLITLLSRLSRITHLSLAHWPVPTVTPHALNATVRHPAHRSLTFAYGGTDSYAASENNWAEAAGILRRLSRATYCLKWLDLEGCGEWIPALNWVGVGPDGEVYPTGPEWNGSWRDIEWMRLGAGWFPFLDGDEHDGQKLGGADGRRSLAASMHAPPPAVDPETSDGLPWDVEEERVKYRRRKELQRYREIVTTAKDVQRAVLRARKEGKGKWVTFSFGLERLEDDALKKLLGPQWLGLLP